MQAIGDYTQLVKLFLGEAAKYLVLFIFLVLAVRLWRRMPSREDPNRRKTVALAGFTSAATVVIGYFAICHSLGLLYSAYAMRAFREGNIVSALRLFQNSNRYWTSADAIGGVGTCLFLLDDTEHGGPLLAQAQRLRNGKSTAFEEHYQGLFYFFHDQPAKAFPLLKDSSADVVYRWDATKILAAMLLEKNQPTEATRLVQPFLFVEVKDCDHAYVMASLRLSKGEKTEALALLNRFPADTLTDFWKERFDKLRTKASGQTS